MLDALAFEQQAVSFPSALQDNAVKTAYRKLDCDLCGPVVLGDDVKITRRSSSLNCDAGLMLLLNCT